MRDFYAFEGKERSTMASLLHFLWIERQARVFSPRLPLKPGVCFQIAELQTLPSFFVEFAEIRSSQIASLLFCEICFTAPTRKRPANQNSQGVAFGNLTFPTSWARTQGVIVCRGRF